MEKKTIKYMSELNYWKERYSSEGEVFKNDHYQVLMEKILNHSGMDIFKDKIVADFGCGPRGSLCWINGAKLKLGMDVLVPEYLKFFGSNMKKHDILYVTTTEAIIPVPDNFIDILFTINSFDHVVSPLMMSNEILRIMKFDALFCGSFNLYEPSTATEPLTLTIEKVEKYFISKLTNVSIRIAYKEEEVYKNLFEGKLLNEVDPSRPCILWVTGNKK